MIDIERKMLTANPFSRPGKRLDGVKKIVLHWVANPGTTAMQNRNYFEGLRNQRVDDPKARYASAHLIVGIGGEIVQCVPTDEVAFHCGAKTYTEATLAELGRTPNNCTLGIELCHPDATGKFAKATLDAAAELCAVLCAGNGLDPMRDIWTHSMVTGKECPKWFVASPAEFEEFRESVAALVKDMGKQA